MNTMRSLFGEHRFLHFAGEHAEVSLEADEPKNEIDTDLMELDEKLDTIDREGSDEDKEEAEEAVGDLQKSYDKISRGVFEELEESGAFENIGHPVEYRTMNYAQEQMPYPQARAVAGMQYDPRTGMFYPFSRAEYGYNIGANVQNPMYFNPRMPNSAMQILHTPYYQGQQRFMIQQQPVFLGPNGRYNNIMALLKSGIYGDTNTSLHDLMENMRLGYRPGHTAVHIRDNGPTSQSPQGERPKQEDAGKEKTPEQKAKRLAELEAKLIPLQKEEKDLRDRFKNLTQTEKDRLEKLVEEILGIEGEIQSLKGEKNNPDGKPRT